ncbi:MAG: T9SS type A sorting domain-containing protein [Chlorobi bacterium]|nr:T9SS type A sorting domain-containing protein [Chlorobiota bacterium]
MKKTLLFTSMFIFAALSGYAQKSYSDDFQSYSDGYDITLEDVYDINTDKTESATVVVDAADANNLCIEMVGVPDSTGLTFKIKSGDAFSGFTADDNGDYIYKARIYTELAGTAKLNIYGTTGLENIVVGSTDATDWTEVTTTFTVNTTEAVYPTFVVYSWKNQKVYIDDVQIYKDGATAIRDINNADVNVYPNPAANTVFLNGTANVESVEICDITGRKAMNTTLQAGNKIDVSALQQGVYLIKVSTDQGTKVVKFIKK